MNTLLEQDSELLAFGRYTLQPGRGELHIDGGRPVALGPRATAVLMALIAARGGVVSQNSLLEHAWPGQEIHPSNLRVQIAALRKVLGEDRELIGTVAGRGYVFTGRLSSASAVAARSATMVAPCKARLPLPMAELIGREAQLQDALAQLASCRLLTLAGPGGIGKTQLALALAHRAAAEPSAAALRVVWTELADLPDACGEPDVVQAVACALGLEREGGPALGLEHGLEHRLEHGLKRGLEPTLERRSGAGAAPHTPATLAAAIAEQPMLLVLDNCEHVVDALAGLVEVVLRRCPQLRLLATSRQPLLAAGETVWRVPSLAVPHPDVVDAAHLLQYSAVQLFVARVRAADGSFSPAPRVTAQVAAICARLEGLPLAIELAAACVPALGVEQTAAGLDDMLRLLRHGRRNAPVRHQSMRAALDWSFALLSEPMRCALLHLATLPDGFALDAAVAALAARGFSAFDAIDALAGLVAHSLAQVDHGSGSPRYRFSGTTRAYALALRGAGQG